MKYLINSILLFFIFSSLNIITAQDRDVGMVDIRNSNHPFKHTLATGITALPVIWIKNYGNEPLSGDTIPFVIELMNQEFDFIYVLENELNPGDSVSINVPLYIEPPTTAGPIEICGWTKLDDDIDTNNDKICIEFNSYQTNRDVGVSSIMKPEDGQTIRRGEEFELEFSVQNFGDSDLVYMQRIGIEIALNGIEVFQDAIRVEEEAGLESGNSINVIASGFQMGLDVPIGENEVCIKTIWGIDNNPVNDESCIIIHIDYPSSVKKLTQEAINTKIFPNPASDYAYLTYQINKKEFVSVKIYDLQGRLVKSIVNEIQTAGQYNLRLNTENLESGLYMYSILTDTQKLTGNLIIDK